MPLLYEATSPRGDHGIWCLTYGQPSKTPFFFDWQGKTAGGKLISFDIDTSCYVKFFVKEFVYSETNILEYQLQMKENNCVMIEINQEDCFKLVAGKTYHGTIVLYDKDGNIIKVLLRDLPIKVMYAGGEPNE